MSKPPSIGWKPQNYEARVASARIRCLNMIRELRSQRYPIEAYRDRHAAGYRAVVFSKAYTPKDIALAERLRARGTTIVFDLCDNHFLLGRERVTRLKTMFELADRWVVSSPALAEVVQSELGVSRPLQVIEDAVEPRLRGAALDVMGRLRAHYRLRSLRRFLNGSAARGATPLVWFGNHKASYGDSGLSHVEKLRPLLERIAARQRVTLTVISNSREVFGSIFTDWSIPVHYLDWNAHTFFAALKLHRVALIPIEVNAFTQVKTNNRIALSLSLGLGVVADAIPSYQPFADCAFLDDWEQGLLAYLERPHLVDEHVACARRLIRERYSATVIAQRWRALFDSI